MQLYFFNSEKILRPKFARRLSKIQCEHRTTIKLQYVSLLKPQQTSNY